MFQHVVLSDSIPKYVQAKFTKVSFHKGDKIQNLMDKVRFDPRIDIKGCDFILIMVGTNDISHLVSTGLIKLVTVQHIMHQYQALHQVIHHRNRHATLIFLAILPRAYNFDLFFPLVFGLNLALEKWCAKSAGRQVFIHTHKLFLRGSTPKLEQYSRSDGIHPNGAGTDILEAFIQQALSPQFLLENLNSKSVNS